MAKNYDFSGWCTKNNLKCSDGLTIIKDAFKHNDKCKVPLVWNHQHKDINNVLGHAVLENREEGVYAYCKFNDSENGQIAKIAVQNGDVSALSIYANQLKKNGNNVLHGNIREVSLVLAGANPGALIENVYIKHSDKPEEEGIIIYTDEMLNNESGEIVEHAEEENNKNKTADTEVVEETTIIEHAEKEEKTMDQKEKTVADVFNELTDEQKTAVYAIVGELLEEQNGGNQEMKQNAFDQNQIYENEENVLTHSEIEGIFKKAKSVGSLKEAVEDAGVELKHSVNDIDWLFPEATNLNKTPEWIKRDTGWVAGVLNGVHKSPFSRIKSVFADIREDEARARGYLKGTLKKEEVFGLLKRSTTPTTVYKKQKLDRDDIVDITDFDVVAWIKAEMRRMLDEEIARAVLIGDGRPVSSDDKISEQHIRPIYNDAELFTVQAPVQVAQTATAEEKAKLFIKAVIKNRKHYKGSGNPKLYTTEDLISDCLLIEDENGRFIYDSMEKLKNVLRVSEIVTVPVMEGQKGKNGGDLLAILVNLNDYNLGADKGGAVNMFDDFDIDYNQQKYLIETRCSGALTKPFSAIAFELEVQA